MSSEQCNHSYGERGCSPCDNAQLRAQLADVRGMVDQANRNADEEHARAEELRAENERLKAALAEFAKWSVEGTRGGMGSGLFMYPVLSPSARNEMQRVVEQALNAPAKET